MLEKRLAHSHSLKLQGVWTSWHDETVSFDFSWRNIMGVPPIVVSFALNASINYLKTPDILRNIWAIKVSGCCAICQCQQATLHHILSNCETALRQKRYWWRHDCVLQHIQAVLVTFLFLCNSKALPTRERKIAPLAVDFIPEGAPPPPPRRKASITGLLHKANDWKLLVDYLHTPFVFPPEIYPTTLRPDIVIWSPSLATVIFIELTCPMEENLVARMHDKIARYTELKASIEATGKWKVVLHTIEVGARGRVHDRPARKCLRSLGFSPIAISKIIKDLSLLSTRASLTIYMHRNIPCWEYLKDTPLLRTSDCTLTDFEKLRFKLSTLSAKEVDCWTPSFDFKKHPSSQLDITLSTIHKNPNPDHNRSARAEALQLLSSIAP